MVFGVSNVVIKNGCLTSHLVPVSGVHHVQLPDENAQ